MQQDILFTLWFTLSINVRATLLFEVLTQHINNTFSKYVACYTKLLLISLKCPLRTWRKLCAFVVTVHPLFIFILLFHLYCSFLCVNTFFLLSEQAAQINYITLTDTHLPTDGCRAAEVVRGELGSANFYNRKSAWSQPTHQGCWEAGGPGPQPWERHKR